MNSTIFHFFRYKLQVTNYIYQITLLFVFFFSTTCMYAAYLKDIPMEVVQPNGDTLHCYASGDEFFNYLHDKDGFTIIQNSEGYYMYAMFDEDKIIPSQYMAGTVNPLEVGLQPHVLISTKEYQMRRAEWFKYEDISRAKTPGRNHGTMNNLVVFIKFQDQIDIVKPFSTIDNMYNSTENDYNSMFNYFFTTSYGHFKLHSHFFPEPDGEQILTYIDEYSRNYYRPYNENSNPEGYTDDRTEREHELLRKAIEFIADMVPADLNIDYDDDGYVDNVCFVIKGGATAWSTLLWPHRWSLFSQEAYIHGKRVWDYNFMLEGAVGYFNTAVLSHEMQHSLSYPDLYHYANGGPTPVGNWDIMESNPNPPQQSGGYMKWKYGNWLDEPTEIQPGKYTLNSIGSGLGFVSYKIPSSNPDQFFVLEYRNYLDPFEKCYSNASGMLIYRINTNWNGNAGYNPDEGILDEVYIFRPGGNSPIENGTISQAHFGVYGRTSFDANSNPKPFLTDGTWVNDLSITDISVTENKVSFTYNGGTTQFVSVAYHPNGTEGSMSPQMFEANVPQQLHTNTFTFENKPFLGWATTPHGTVEYTDNQTISIEEDLVLYAIFEGMSTGITEIEKTNGLFSIHPNPAENYVEIVLSDEVSATELTAHIFDLYGRELSSHRLITDSFYHKIDISNLSKGFYLVRIENEVQKLIVK